MPRNSGSLAFIMKKFNLLKQLWHPQVSAFYGFSISGFREKSVHVKKTIFKLIMNKL